MRIAKETRESFKKIEENTGFKSEVLINRVLSSFLRAWREKELDRDGEEDFIEYMLSQEDKYYESWKKRNAGVIEKEEQEYKSMRINE